MPGRSAEERLRIEQRQAKVNDLLAMDIRRPWQIAQRLGMDLSTRAAEQLIRRDIAVIEKQWLESQNGKQTEYRAKAVARLTKLKAEAIEAWERSKRDDADGDPRFLMAAAEFERQIAAKQGTDKPVKVDVKEIQERTDAVLEQYGPRIGGVSNSPGKNGTAGGLNGTNGTSPH